VEGVCLNLIKDTIQPYSCKDRVKLRKSLQPSFSLGTPSIIISITLVDRAHEKYRVFKKELYNSIPNIAVSSVTKALYTACSYVDEELIC
jgi:hypothetical protein